MIVSATGGNPNVYAARWNRRLTGTGMGCTGCGVGRIRPINGGLGDIGMPTLIMLFAGLYFLPKLLKS